MAEDNLDDIDLGPDALKYFERLMNAWDPSDQSDTLRAMLEVEKENNGEPPTSEQWAQIMDIALHELEHKPVTIKQKADAAKVLAEYQHAKKKSVEITTNGGNAVLPELTEKELDAFDEWFDRNF